MPRNFSAFNATAIARALGLAALLAGAASATQAADACPAMLQMSQPRLQDERPVKLCDYAGKVLLVVNTASHCGFTQQYKSLEALHQKYRDKGLVVLGFPTNDFGAQEPGSNAQIADFCENTFGVKFPMFAKSSVLTGKGQATNPLFASLFQRTGQAPDWNFHKYLVGRDGQTVLSFASQVDPQDPEFSKGLQKLLNAN